MLRQQCHLALGASARSTADRILCIIKTKMASADEGDPGPVRRVRLARTIFSQVPKCAGHYRNDGATDRSPCLVSAAGLRASGCADTFGCAVSRWGRLDPEELRASARQLLPSCVRYVQRRPGHLSHIQWPLVRRDSSHDTVHFPTAARGPEFSIRHTQSEERWASGF